MTFPILVAFDNILVKRGNPGLILYCKEIRSVYLKYVSSEGKIPVLSSSLGCTKDGIPKVLGDFIPIIRRSVSPETELIRKDQQSLQLLNSLL
jgi:hypothetical protein